MSSLGFQPGLATSQGYAAASLNGEEKGTCCEVLTRLAGRAPASSPLLGTLFSVLSLSFSTQGSHYPGEGT